MNPTRMQLLVILAMGVVATIIGIVVEVIVW